MLINIEDPKSAATNAEFEALGYPPFMSDVLAVVAAYVEQEAHGSAAYKKPTFVQATALLAEALVSMEIAELESDDPHTRNVILRMLGHLGMLVKPEIFIRATRDPVPYVRATAATALSSYPGKRSVKALLECLADDDEEVRAAAAYAAGEIDAHDAVPALLDLLGAPDPQTRILALRSLGKIADERAVVRLHEQLRDPNPEISVRAKQALRKIAANSGGASST